MSDTPEQETLLEFPCDFPIKAMGAVRDDFDALVVELVRRHAPDLAGNAVRLSHSSAGRFVSVTVTVRATSKDQLDNIYRELTACEHIAMVL